MVDSERQRLSFLHSRFGRRRFSCKILGLLLGQLPGTRCTRTPTTPTTPLTRHQLKTSENQVERRRLSTLSKCFLQKHLAKSYSKIIFISFHTDVISDVLNVSDLENALSNCAPHLWKRFVLRHLGFLCSFSSCQSLLIGFLFSSLTSRYISIHHLASSNYLYYLGSKWFKTQVQCKPCNCEIPKDERLKSHTWTTSCSEPLHVQSVKATISMFPVP